MLIRCRDCGHEISRSAHACPECGRPTGRAPRKQGLFSATFTVIVSAFFIIFIMPWLCCATPFLALLVPDDDKPHVVSTQPKPNEPRRRAPTLPTSEPEPVREMATANPVTDNSKTLAKKVTREPTPAAEPPDPFAACREWGKDDEFIEALFTKYLDARRTVSAEQRMKSAKLSCRQRVSRSGDREEMDACIACVTDIAAEVYGTTVIALELKKLQKPTVIPKRARLSHGQAFLRQYHRKLMGFKGSSDFHRFGFAIGGKYNKWLTSLGAKRKNPIGTDGKPFAILERIGLGYLEQLGLAYASSRGSETATTRKLTKEVENAIAGKGW